MIALKDILEAQKVIAPHIRHTVTVKNHSLSKQIGTNAYLKLELFQKTGSFKPRAAFNKMLRLSQEERNRGVVTVSGGNFAQGVAYAGNTLEVRTLIIMPAYTPKNYLEATRSYGAQIELVPDVDAAFNSAELYKSQGWTFIHSYDDPDIMAGNGTVGLELVNDLPELTDAVISVGGGGLMSGCVIAIKGIKRKVRIWNVETEGSDTLGRALQAGKVVRTKPTSLAKTLGATYVAADALIIAQRYGEGHILVTDREAYEAQRFLLERTKILTELSASCTLAAANKLQSHFSKDNHVALILCGGNISLDDLAHYKSKFEND